MSVLQTRLSVDVAVGTDIRRADAIFRVLCFAVEFLRLSRVRPLLEKGVRDRPWVTRLRIVSEDDKEIIHQELVFEIDWSRHELHLATGNATLTVPDSKGIVSSVSPELIRALRMFDEHRARTGQHLTFYVVHRDDLNEGAGKALGLGSPVTLRYAGERLDVPISTGELDELGATYRRYGSRA